MRVLVVDDDAAIREMLAAILELEDAEVLQCASASEAVKALAENAFDLVVTDMWMETPTAGLDVVSAATRASSAPPVVVLTAFPVREAEVQEHGPATVMQKGASPSGLIQKLRNIVALARQPLERVEHGAAERKNRS
jgi:DNA-binding NtrC family response regulator